MTPKLSLGNRFKGLRALLMKSWTILPRRGASYPEPNSWWPIAVIVIVMIIFTLSAMYYDPYSPFRTAPIQPLVSLDEMAPTAPHFAEGAPVRLRLAGTVYTSPSAQELMQEALPENNAGVVIDGVWKKGRWLYQVRFSPTVTGWVGEPDLILIR